MTFFAFCKSSPEKPKVKRPNKASRRPQKALQLMPRSGQGALVVRQVSRCALWCHCRLRVIPLRFCCACGICLGLFCAFCACYALYSSRLWPSSGAQHPVFRVLQTPVRVKEEPPHSPERHADPEGGSDTEMSPEGNMIHGDTAEI